MGKTTKITYVMLYTYNLVGKLSEEMGTSCWCKLDSRKSLDNLIHDGYLYAKKEDNFKKGIAGFQIRRSFIERKFDYFQKLTEIIDFKIYDNDNSVLPAKEQIEQEELKNYGYKS
jgi:hypothetical protein